MLRKDQMHWSHGREGRVWIFYSQKACKEVCHRSNGPAIEEADGTKWWYEKDEIHRSGGPAIEDVRDQLSEWYDAGWLHREDGPARVHWDGRVEYWKHGVFQREE